MISRSIHRVVCDKRAIYFALATCSFYMISVKLNKPIDKLFDSCAVPEEAVHDNEYISNLCKCSKVIPVRNEEALNQSRKFRWCSIESDLRGSHQRVVTYALFGDASNVTVYRRYYSSLRNLTITTERVYPGWVVRFYHNFDEHKDKEAYKALCNLYCRHPHVDLCRVEDIWKGIGNSTIPIDPSLIRNLNRKMHRYLVMLDPQVDTFISRDVDSFIYPREVDAVNEWLQSNYTFHLMRDHPMHRSIILAGMWGVKIHQRRDLIQGLARALIVEGQDQYGSRDQSSLHKILWPVAKFDVMAHDSYNCATKHVLETSPIKLFPFPTRRNGSYYVGGAGHELYPEKCPVACRPPDHQDWEYC